MRCLPPSAIDRRGFCRSIAVLTCGGIMARLLSGTAWCLEGAIGRDEYFVVNGWVLTRADVATMELAQDAVRLQ
jgi:hypothetical protein